MLLEKLKLDAGEKVFETAVAYYQSAAIKPYSYSPSGTSRYQIKAIVKASGAFGVNISLDFGNDRLKIDAYCTCASGNDTLCEHATAVVYKFIADDFPKLNPGLAKPVQPEGVELLKLAAGPDETVVLFYQIGGLNDLAENFTIIFQVPEGHDPLAGQLTECLGDINFSARKREQILNSFAGFDQLVISYLERLLNGKDSRRKCVFLPKTPQSLQLILVLIQNARALHHADSRPLAIGEPLKPRLMVSGDETRLQFTYDTTEFETAGFFNPDLNYIIHENTVQWLNTSGLGKIPPEIAIAPEQLGELLFDTLPKLRRKIRLDLAPELLSHRLVMHEPEISLFLDYEQGKITCQPEIKLPDQVYRNQDCQRLLTGAPKFERSEPDPNLWFTVNRQPFVELLDFLKRFQFEFQTANWVIHNRESQLTFIRHGWPQLQEKWPFHASPAFAEFKVTPAKLEPLIKLELDERIDWFEFHISYNLGGQTFTHQQIMSLLQRFGSGNYLQIGSQWFFVDESAKFDLLQQSLSPQAGSDTSRERVYNLAFFRDLLREQGVEIKGNGIYNRFEADISNTGLLESSPIPASFQGELREYQKAGFHWLHFLHKYRFGGILADDMGLGKTVQVLTLLKSLPKPEPVLIICPRSLIYNWAAEIDKFYPGTARLIYHGSPETREQLRAAFPKQEIIITTYDTVVNDIESLEKIPFYYCILDEAQHIKNRDTQRAKDCKRIQSRHRLVLTGTPVENRLEDLWALFDFLMPGYLGSMPEFQEKYTIPLRRKAKQSETLALLRKKIAPFMLRRVKEEVLAELPPKIMFTREIAMSQLQEDAYLTVLKQVKQDVINSVTNMGFNKSRLMVLSALTKLRQICDHPGLALPEISPEADSGKLDALLELINEAVDGGHKIVVFSQFVRMLKLIRAKLQENKINYQYLDGATTDRIEQINSFNNSPEIPVFLISLKAGGVGINLTAADIVIHAEPWWNPMVENQATDRVHRIGQQKQVMVYKLVTLGTVEEKLIQLQERKKAVFEAIIQDNSDPVSSLTWEEIKDLFEITDTDQSG